MNGAVRPRAVILAYIHVFKLIRPGKAGRPHTALFVGPDDSQSNISLRKA